MPQEQINYIAASFFSCAISVMAAMYAVRQRDKAGALAFVGLMLASSIYAFGYAFELASSDLPEMMFWSKLQYVGIAAIPAFWNIMVLQYTSQILRLHYFTVVILFFIPAATLLLRWTNDWHQLLYVSATVDTSHSFARLDFAPGMWYFVHSMYINCSLAVGYVLLARMWWKTASLYRRQIAFMLIVAALPWAGQVVYLFDDQPGKLDLTPFGFALSAPLLAYGLFRFKLFQLLPIARETILDVIREGVLVFDEKDQLIDFNPAVSRMIKQLSLEGIGLPAAVVLADYAPLLSQVTRNPHSASEIELYLEQAEGNRCYISSFSPVVNKQGRLIGKTIVLTDVTVITEQSRKLEEAHTQLIQSEKMAVLGQLVAGVAHEINTPLAVIKSIADQMAGKYTGRLMDVFASIQRLEAEDVTRFFEMIQSGTTSSLVMPLSTKEERLWRRKIAAFLQERGVADSHQIADRLVNLRIIEDLSKYLDLLQRSDISCLLDAALILVMPQQSASAIRMAVEKTNKIVYALKSFAHRDLHEAPVTTDVVEGIEVVVAIYQNYFHAGVRLVRQYETVPCIVAYPDDLKQVWANIIHNAIQAMNGKGILQINVLTDEENVVVKFTDDGPGIAPEFLSRIFEPLFTTKRAGEGSGLGLEICRSIIAKHKGTIGVTSQAGETCFTICLAKECRA